MFLSSNFINSAVTAADQTSKVQDFVIILVSAYFAHNCTNKTYKI